MPEQLLHPETTDAVIKAYYAVYNSLGPGFLERVYRNSMAIKLRQSGVACELRRPIDVFFETLKVGRYYADLIVSEVVIVEIRAHEKLTRAHEAELVNYLKATPVEVGLLLNFGSEKPESCRRILTNDRKPHLRKGSDTEETGRTGFK